MESVVKPKKFEGSLPYRPSLEKFAFFRTARHRQGNAQYQELNRTEK